MMRRLKSSINAKHTLQLTQRYPEKPVKSVDRNHSLCMSHNVFDKACENVTYENNDNLSHAKVTTSILKELCYEAMEQTHNTLETYMSSIRRLQQYDCKLNNFYQWIAVFVQMLNDMIIDTNESLEYASKGVEFLIHVQNHVKSIFSERVEKVRRAQAELERKMIAYEYTCVTELEASKERCVNAFIHERFS